MPIPRFALAVVVMLVAVPGSSVPAEAARCEGGRFVRRSVPLVAGPVAGLSGAEAIVVTTGGGPRVAINPICDAVRAQLKGTRKGTRLKATWPRGACRGITDTVQLRGKIAAGCAALTGTMKQSKRKRTQFTAYLATGCGDGLLDTGAGEQCEIDRHCGARDHCRQCRCEARQSEEPATTTTTTAATTTTTMPVPPVVLHVEAGSALEFGAIGVGDSATAAFVVSNVAPGSGDGTASVAVDSPAFVVLPSALDLPEGGPAQAVTVKFRPLATGHQTAVITISAADGDEVALLAHGFGGSAPGTGPTLAAEPLFFASGAAGGGTPALIGLLPSGLRFSADPGLRSCIIPDNATSGDACTRDTDCSGDRVCVTVSYCVGGDEDGRPCTRHSDCPDGTCPAEHRFVPTDMCGDGTGGLYLINENSGTDPTTQEPRGTVARLTFDPATGARTGNGILYRPLPGTTRIACDGLAPAAGGRVFVPEHRPIPNPSPLCKDELEALLSVSKETAAVEVVPGLDDVDTAAGHAPCDTFDPVVDVGAARNGASLFVTLGATGLSRILPQPPLGLVTDFFDRFEIHPDGSLVVVVPSDFGGSGFLDVYRVSPADGPFLIAALTPCATFAFPNAGGDTVVGEVAVGRSQAGADDGTILVTFATSQAGSVPPLSATLLPRGTVAFDAPAGTSGCGVRGLINLELLTDDLMTF